MSETLVIALLFAVTVPLWGPWAAMALLSVFGAAAVLVILAIESICALTDAACRALRHLRKGGR